MGHRMFASAILFAAPLALACGSAPEEDESPQENEHTDTSKPSTPTGTDEDGTFEPTTNDASDARAPVDKFVPPTTLGCPARAQDLLVLDFRSGWWAGGGGGDYTATVLPLIAGACPQTSVEYHHFEILTHVKCIYTEKSGGGCQSLRPLSSPEDIRASFQHGTTGDYTQIWILSGSDQDSSDIPSGDALFKSIMADTNGACIPMLVAAGDGFMTHANSIAQDLGIGPVFTQMTNPPSFFSKTKTATEARSSISGSSMKSHVLFKDVSSIVDQVGSLSRSAHGDALASSAPAPTIYDVIAHDGSGKPTIAVGAAKEASGSYRPFIFDAGWQRTYVLDKGTAQYLKNLVMYMGLVGCKAAPIGEIN